MFNFSFTLIARNEEKTLPRLIKSIQYFMDNWGEVIVVDTWSTDNTAQIARDLGCKVTEVGDRFKIKINDEYARRINERFVMNWEDPVVNPGDYLFDFASARNFASSLATNDFVFSPDCDEVWTQFNYEKVSELINEWITQLEYSFVFAHDEHGNPTITFMHSKAFDRRFLSWKGIVHEVLQWYANRKYVEEDILKLEHFQNHETNRTWYLKGLAVDCYEHPENDRNSHYLGREMLWTGRTHSAIKELERHITLGGWNAEKAQSMIYIGEGYERLWDSDKALASYFQAYITEPNMREALMKLAEFHFNRNQWTQVIAFCNAMLDIPQWSFYASQTENYTHKPHHFLYVAYWQIGNKEKSTEHFWKAYKFCPLHSKYLHDIRFYRKLPKISIIAPTLWRIEGVERLKQSIDSLNYPKELIEVIIEEDTELIGVPKMVKRLYEKSTGEYIVYAANDMEFHSDSLIISIMEIQRYDRDVWRTLLAFNSWELYPDQGNICEHFIIERYFIDEYLNGEIFDIDFHHVWVDNLLWTKACKYGIAERSENAIVIHNHFSRTWVMDEIYTLAYSHAEKDRALLANKILII